MATFEKTITVKIRAYSSASEADMSTYGDSLVEDFKQVALDFRNRSWYQELYTDWDQSVKVDLEVSLT
jgi:hypothetical protein